MNTIILCLTIFLICICICCTILYYKYLDTAFYTNSEERLADKIDKASIVLSDLEDDLEDCDDENVKSELNKLRTILTY